VSQEHSVLFILGAQKGGTTWLFNALDTHPSFVGADHAYRSCSVACTPSTPGLLWAATVYCVWQPAIGSASLALPACATGFSRDVALTCIKHA
jgi:hypothetical protein